MADLLGWSGSDSPGTYEIVRGDLQALRDTVGDLGVALDECMADNAGTSMPYEVDPAVGHGFWFLVRRATPSGDSSYDSGGLGQLRGRDESIAAAGLDCF